MICTRTSSSNITASIRYKGALTFESVFCPVCGKMLRSFPMVVQRTRRVVLFDQKTTLISKSQIDLVTKNLYRNIWRWFYSVMNRERGLRRTKYPLIFTSPYNSRFFVCLFVCFNRRWRLTWPSPMHHSSSFLPVTAVTMATCLKTTTALQHGLRWVENQVHVYAGLCLREIPWQPRILHRNTNCALKLQLEEVLN